MSEPIEVRNVKGLGGMVEPVPPPSVQPPPPPIGRPSSSMAPIGQLELRELDAISARLSKLEKNISRQKTPVLVSLPLFVIAALLVINTFKGKDVVGTPRPAASASRVVSAGTLKLTIDQFRAEIIGGDYSPKTKFYEEYGKPLRTTSIGDDVYMFYECADGTARIMCPIGPFEHQDWIAPVAVDPH